MFCVYTDTFILHGIIGAYSTILQFHVKYICTESSPTIVKSNPRYYINNYSKFTIYKYPLSELMLYILIKMVNV